eukprot:472319-Pleurochrysis_carterae.AAC.2
MRTRISADAFLPTPSWRSDVARSEATPTIGRESTTLGVALALSDSGASCSSTCETAMSDERCVSRNGRRRGGREKECRESKREA